MSASFAVLLRRLRAERQSLLWHCIVACVVGVVIAISLGEEFQARTRLLPYRSLAASAGSLSGLAGLAGIRLPTGIAEQIITADLYPEVAKSQDFALAVAETPLRFQTLDRRATAIEYFREIRRRPVAELLVDYTVGLPGTLRDRLGSPPSAHVDTLRADSAAIPAFDRRYMKLISKVSDRVVVTMDRKTSVITITGTMPDRYAAADLVRVTSNLLMRRIIEFEVRKAREQFRFASEQFALAKNRYQMTQRELATFSDQNRMLVSATAQITRDRLERERDLAFEVYQQFSRELEQARIKMNQDTPVFTILDHVSVPAERLSPRRSVIVLIVTLLGGLIGFGRLWLRSSTRPSVVEAA